MTETRQYIGFGDVENFLVKSYKRITGGHEFDIDKYGPYVDAVKHVLVPSLEKQILFFLERFVYNEDFQQSSYRPYLDRYKESMLTAYAKYNEIGTSIEAMRDSLTIDNLVDFLGHSFLTNNRLAKISNDLNAMGIEKNWLGYVNVLNFINEKDFWTCSSSSGNIYGQYSSICSASNDNILSDMNAEKGSHIVERMRGYKRPRKRAATHINRKHYKLERLAQLSDRSFRVTESLYDLLKSNWVLHDFLHTKRRLMRNCGDLRRPSFACHRRNHRKTDWKNANLTLFIRKIDRPGAKTVDAGYPRNSEVRTFSSLPCRVEQLLSKLDRIDPTSTRFHCSFIQKKFQTKLYNVCSCLNNLLSTMDAQTINSIYLVCEIRTDCLKFNLKQTTQSKSNSPLFSARVMTCEALYRYGIRKNGSRQNLKSRSSWAAKKANELSIRAFVDPSKVCQEDNPDFDRDGAISSIEISFTGCEGSAVDPQNVAKGLTCGPEDLGGLTLGDSLSINDVMQKLKLSPFNLQETEQSFRIRSKIRDIVRSIMICTQEHSSPDREDGQSISMQAIVSTSSLHAMKHGVEVLPFESKPSKALGVSNMISFIESKVSSSGSEETLARKECVNLKKSAAPKECARLTGSGKSDKSVIPKSCLETKGQSLRSGGSVRPNKSLKISQASSSSRESAKLKNKNMYKICTTPEKKPIKSREFTGSHRRPLSKKIVESIASEISNALARTKSNGSRLTEDEQDYDIDVTVEIEEISESSDNITESISRHTHLLPSMKSVKLGTSPKYFPHYYEKSTSSESEVSMRDNFTTMNKSVVSDSNRETISAQSYDRIKHLIREKVCNKLSETDSCQPNSSKSIVSSGKYYISIPSSKTNRVRLRHETSESSSTSRDSLDLRVCSRRQRNPKAPSSDDESIFSESSDCLSPNSTQSSRAATFDRNSIYGCIEDRLANRYFKDILNDYSEEGESPKYRDAKAQILYQRIPRPDDWRLDSDERETRSYCYPEISSEENETGYSQSSATDDDACTNISWANDGIGNFYQRYPVQEISTPYVLGKTIVQGTRRVDDYESFWPRRTTGWSTCAVGSSSSKDCVEIHPPKSNRRMNMKDRADSQRKNSAFGSLNIIENYKKRFKNIDRKFRAKLLQYLDFCKNVKSNLRKQICLDDICEASRTSISSSDLKRHKYSGAYFNG